jgi:hypothetical protein
VLLSRFTLVLGGFLPDLGQLLLDRLALFRRQVPEPARRLLLAVGRG